MLSRAKNYVRVVCWFFIWPL